MLAFAVMKLFFLSSPENPPKLRSSFILWYQSAGLHVKQEAVKTEAIAN